VSVVIEHPIEEVFARMTDRHSNPEWDARLLKVRQTPEGLEPRGGQEAT
jgi:uncharacterized protein YndB with AHSA1/START domain